MSFCELGWVQQSDLKLVENNKVIFVDAYNKSRWFSTISGNTREKFVAANSRYVYFGFFNLVLRTRDVYFGFFNLVLRTQDMSILPFFCCMHFRKEHYRIYVHCVGYTFLDMSASWAPRKERNEDIANVSIHCDCNFSISMYLVYKIDALSYNNQICAMVICAPHVYFASAELQECFFSIKFLSIQMPFTFVQ
ncbi:hypothetical protein AMTRI_Chr11g97020 [Amborella trichopoda]